MRDKKKSDRDNLKVRKNRGHLGLSSTVMFLILMAVFIGSCTKEDVNNNSRADKLIPADVISAIPAKSATAVDISIQPAVTFSKELTVPAINSTRFTLKKSNIAVNGTVTFSEAMDPLTISSTTLSLKQGTVAVTDTVTYSGTAATFTPSGSLGANLVYTGTITTGAKDVAGNSIASNYSWSFTTAAQSDVTPPTVLSTVPVNSSTSIAVNSKITATFSEAMNSSTLTAATFTLKQGATALTGTVTYSGTTATFTPSGSLGANLVYTGTITTGAKDAAGNSMAGNYTWSFTTAAAAPAGLSFAADVVPVLNLCNNCHKHPWTTSAIASTYYTNLVNSGYVNQTTYTSSKIYIKLNSGHPGSGVSTVDIDKILNWMKEGSKNN